MEYNVQITILALVAVAALALLLQTIFLVAALVIARKAARSVREEMEQYRSSIMPIILKARDLIQNVAPKVEQSANELAAITRSLRAQTANIEAAANDIIGRTQRQVGRLDSMLTSVFDRVERAAGFMTDAVTKPMRQLSGIIASVRAAVEALRSTEVPHHAQGTARYPDGEPRQRPASGRDAYL